MSASIADAAKPYLEYLDKEMTIQGILSAFCVASGALIFDKALAADPKGASTLLSAVQSHSYPYLFAAILSLFAAALMFYLQRSELAWLYGILSLAVTREMQGVAPPAESYSFQDGLTAADSWSLWTRYKCGLAFLAATAAEIVLALCFVIPREVFFRTQWIIAAGPILLAALIGLSIRTMMKRRDRTSDNQPSKS